MFNKSFFPQKKKKNLIFHVFLVLKLALTAASPFYRGYITDIDCRWTVISQSVDCRTREERGLEPLKNNKFKISKSRYDSIDSYLSERGEKYNDVPLTYDPEIYNQLLENGIDKLLAQHIAHLFIRDSVSLFSEKVHQNDEEDTDHFEVNAWLLSNFVFFFFLVSCQLMRLLILYFLLYQNLQSTNWQTMRFKPPPPNSPIGWRVEFRPCEVQITDFENAAIVCFIVLLTRVILSYKLDLLIPISKVDENITRAHKRDAVKKEKFWFRSDIYSDTKQEDIQEEYKEFTINEIINGKVIFFFYIFLKWFEGNINSVDKIMIKICFLFTHKQEGVFPGLIPLVNSYLASMDVDADTHCTIQRYLKFIQKRANGELLTTAAWLRKEVMSHPDYK